MFVTYNYHGIHLRSEFGAALLPVAGSIADRVADIVRDAFARYPVIDRSRVYVTGFSNGGAAAVALTDQYPELFSAIAPEGWMVGMRDWSKKGKEYDMPFQIIQGSEEYTYETSSGAMAIMTDEQEALSDLMLFKFLS